MPNLDFCFIAILKSSIFYQNYEYTEFITNTHWLILITLLTSFFLYIYFFILSFLVGTWLLVMHVLHFARGEFLSKTSHNALSKLCKTLPHIHCQPFGRTSPLTPMSASFVFYNSRISSHAVTDRTDNFYFHLSPSLWIICVHLLSILYC